MKIELVTHMGLFRQGSRRSVECRIETVVRSSDPRQYVKVAASRSRGWSGSDSTSRGHPRLSLSVLCHGHRRTVHQPYGRPPSETGCLGVASATNIIRSRHFARWVGHAKKAPRSGPQNSPGSVHGFQSRPGCSCGWDVRRVRVAELSDVRLKPSEDAEALYERRREQESVAAVTNGAT